MVYLIWASLILFVRLGFGVCSMDKLLGGEVVLLELILFTVNSVDIKVYIFIDWVRCIFVSVVLFISSIVVYYRDRYITGDPGKNKFIYLVLLFVMSMVIIIIGPNLVIILLG